MSEAVPIHPVPIHSVKAGAEDSALANIDPAMEERAFGEFSGIGKPRAMTQHQR